MKEALKQLKLNIQYAEESYSAIRRHVKETLDQLPKSTPKGVKASLEMLQRYLEELP